MNSFNLYFKTNYGFNLYNDTIVNTENLMQTPDTDIKLINFYKKIICTMRNIHLNVHVQTCVGILVNYGNYPRFVLMRTSYNLIELPFPIKSMKRAWN